MNKATPSGLNHQYVTKGEALTPFEIYLKYSNEKQNSVKQLSSILQDLSGSHRTILDVGCGDGSYLLQSVYKVENGDNFDITLLEPSDPLFTKLEENIKGKSNCKAIHRKFEEFFLDNKEKYDIVLASHLYHFPNESYRSFILELLSLLNQGGVLIWIERGIDEVTEFKQNFKRKLIPDKYPKDWKARSYKTPLEILENKLGKCKLYVNKSTLDFPYRENMEDTVAIIEFHLNIEWESIPKNIQNEILEYIGKKDGVLKQEEGMIVFTKQ